MQYTIDRATHYGTLKRGEAEYVGGLLDGKKHGPGELTFPDGRKYVGEFQHDKACGHGTYTCPDGTKYVGEFVANNRHGQGRYMRPDGQVCDAPARLIPIS